MNENAIIEAPPATRQQAITTIDTSPSALLRIAVEQGADLDRMERLMALQERWEATEARKSFVQAMASFKAEPLVIFKKKSVGYTTKEGAFVGYKHAELADVTEVIVPAMARHGLSHRWVPRQVDGLVHVDCIVTHSAGHSETITLSAPPDASGKKNSIQAIASTLSYLERYTLLAASGMATTGMDDDGLGGDPEAAKAKQEAMAKRGAELEGMALEIIHMFSDGKEMEAVSVWQNPKHWASELEEANEEKTYVWKTCFAQESKLRAFLKANDRNREAA